MSKQSAIQSRPHSVAASVERYQSAVLAFLRRRLPDWSEAEGLTQEVFASGTHFAVRRTLIST